MSNALAIAAVTAILKDLLQNALVDHDLSAGVGDVTVSTLPPDRIVPAQNGSAPKQLNIFLYQVSPNQGWRNVGMPSRDSRGERLTNPPLALDLRYLLTAYGSADFESEILLGYAMQVLHETPVLTRKAIRKALAPVSPVDGTILPPAFRTLSAADLADQVEQIKISPIFLETEEMSRLWSMFQTHYRSSTAYLVSAVLIESRYPTRVALPVKENGYNIYAMTIRRPLIERVRSEAGQNTLILANQKLTIIGHRLRGKVTQVKIGAGPPVEPAPEDIHDSEISMQIPSDLQAGIQGVQVVHFTDIETAPEEYRNFPTAESNVVAFVLHPTIKKRENDTYEIEKDLTWTEEGEGDNAYKICSGSIKVGLEPNVGKNQRVALLLYEFNTPDDRAPRTHSFWAHPWPPEMEEGDADHSETFDEVSFQIKDVREGSYLVRIQIDGIESPLELGADGKYSNPGLVLAE